MEKYYFFFSEGSVVNQVICALLINLTAFAYGTNMGWISPMALLLQSKDTPTEVPLTDSEISWIAATAFFVGVPVAFLVAIVADRRGRKFTLLVITFANLGCWIILLCSLKTWALIISRVLVGISMSGVYVMCPLYTKEISHDSIRGLLGSFVIFFHTIGNLFLYIIGDFLDYQTILWVGLSIPAIHMCLCIMVPESPSYLLKTGRIDEARKVLAWLRCRNVKDQVVGQELDAFKKELEADEDITDAGMKQIFKNKLLFRAYCIAMFVCIAREVCGAVPVLNFAGNIFAISSEGTSLTLSPNQQAMMLGAVQVTGSILASSIVEKAGRKMLFLISSLVSGASMCALASWFLAKKYDVMGPAWLPIVTLCVCIFCDAAGTLPVCVILATELFSYKYRGTVVASVLAVATLVDFFEVLLFKPMTSQFGESAVFFFFGGLSLLSALYTLLEVPETKNRSLRQIYQRLKNKKEIAETEILEIL